MKMMAEQLCILYHPQPLWSAQGNYKFTLHETDLGEFLDENRAWVPCKYWLLIPLAVLSLEDTVTAFQLKDMAELHLSNL